MHLYFHSTILGNFRITVLPGRPQDTQHFRRRVYPVNLSRTMFYDLSAPRDAICWEAGPTLSPECHCDETLAATQWCNVDRAGADRTPVRASPSPRGSLHKAALRSSHNKQSSRRMEKYPIVGKTVTHTLKSECGAL